MVHLTLLEPALERSTLVLEPLYRPGLARLRFCRNRALVSDVHQLRLDLGAGLAAQIALGPQLVPGLLPLAAALAEKLVVVLAHELVLVASPREIWVAFFVEADVL